MKNVLWCLNHTPTEKQLMELSGRGELKKLSELHPQLFEKLSQCPSEVKTLIRLGDELYEICQSYNTVVLPIGSPAFNFLFASSYNTLGESLMAGYHRNFVCAFAHSERISFDNPDGTKTVRFEHTKFIYL